MALDGGDAFSVLAKEWWEHQKGTWDKGHAQRLWNRLEVNSFVELDKSDHLIKFGHKIFCRPFGKIEERDALDVAARTLQDIRRVFRYAIQTGRLIHNPASDLTGVVKARSSTHRASLPNQELGRFLCDVRQYKSRGRLLTQLAIGITGADICSSWEGAWCTLG